MMKADHRSEKMNTIKFLKGVLLLIGIVIISSSALPAKTIDKIEFPPLEDIEMPEIEKFTLDNGMVVYLHEDHKLPLVEAAIRLAAGEYTSPVDKIGLAEITGEVMRTGGTENHTGDEIDEILEGIGASIECNIGKTSGRIRLNILSEYADIGLQLMADIVRNPIFDEDKIDLEKTAQRSIISRRNDNPDDICIREFMKIIYGSESPIARYPEYATIDNISRDDLIDYHQRYINPENTMLAVWGDFDTDEMKAKVEKYFADWPQGPGKVPALPEVNYVFEPGVHYIEKGNLNQSSILIGHIGGLLGDPDYLSLIHI